MLRGQPCAAGEVPLVGTDEFPKAEFASSTTGTLIISIRRHPGDPGRWRQATDADREQWSTTFHRFIEACLARRSGEADPERQE